MNWKYSRQSSLFFIFYTLSHLYIKQVLPILKLTPTSFQVKHQSCCGFQLISALPLLKPHIFCFNKSCLVGFFQSLCLGRGFCPNETLQKAPRGPGTSQFSGSSPNSNLSSEALVKSLVCSVLYKWLGMQLYFTWNFLDKANSTPYNPPEKYLCA